MLPLYWQTQVADQYFIVSYHTKIHNFEKLGVTEGAVVNDCYGEDSLCNIMTLKER